MVNTMFTVIPFDLTMPVRQFFDEVWNSDDSSDFVRLRASLDELFLPEFQDHNPLLPDQGRGQGGVAFLVSSFREAFPDLRFSVEDIFAGKDRVAVRWRAEGSHRGMFLGSPGTGRRFAITGTDIFRIGRGKIAEAWHEWDRQALSQQLGLTPLPTRSDASRPQVDFSDYRRAA